MKKAIDLRILAEQIVADFPSIRSLWLFGSRRYRTLSLRSDIDVLVCTAGHIRPNDLRQAIRRTCPALDLFLVDGGKATSCMNDSFVQSSDFESLRTRLDSVCIWSADPREIDASAPFTQELLTHITYVPTAMDGGAPRIGEWGRGVNEYFEQVASEGLPLAPYIGDSVHKVAEFLVELGGRVIAAFLDLGARNTRGSWKSRIESEYDFQNAFFLAAKPWLPDLAREEVAICFDGQEKRADFSLLRSRVVIEMKYIKDANTKAAIAKTLDGLANFYGRNANVEVLLFLIAVAPTADVDCARWNAEFSSRKGERRIVTHLYQLAPLSP